MLSEAIYRRDVQVLRGLSVIAVVLFHAEEQYFPSGFLGVDVFFVISGFVVTPLIMRIFTDQNSGRKRFSSLRDFYKRRFYRLAPALAVTLALSALLIFLFGSITDHQRTFRQGLATLFFLGNLGAYKYSGGDYFAPNPNALVHTWSLSVEEQIYIFLPLTLLIILHNHKNVRNISVAFIGIITAMSFTLFLFPAILMPLYFKAGILETTQFTFFSPLERIWQFGLGSLVFLLLERSYFQGKKSPRGICWASFFAIVIILFGPAYMGIKSGSALASLLAALLIVNKSLLVLPELLLKIFEWLGDRSYSIYLLHMPLIYITNYSPWAQYEYSKTGMLRSLIAVAASIFLGALSYSKIENRYRTRGKEVSSKNSGGLRVFVSVFIGPLAMILLLSGLSTTSNKSMDKDRLDNGLCKFWSPNIDEGFQTRFIKCHAQFGRAVVVLGDSHAMNLYNSLFTSTSSNFFVGLSNGGCRPRVQEFNSCPFDDFEKLLKSSSERIERVIYHQSGSYLISDLKGDNDTNLAFKSEESYRIDDREIRSLMRFLNDMGKKVSTTWVGPFAELRIEPTWIEVKTNQVKPNPIVKAAFFALERQIKFRLNESKHTFDYASLFEILGSRQFEYKSDSCVLFRDKDHWSTCAEGIYSSPLRAILKQEEK